MEFDRFSKYYNNDLMKGVSLSGESAGFFAEKRVKYVHDYLAESGRPAESIMEFGCGIGNNIEFLRQYFPESQIIALDVSEDSLRIARERYQNDDKIIFASDMNGSLQDQKVDLIFVNGVFHHIATEHRVRYLHQLYKFLKEEAALVIFENNPFNLGARWVMSRIPFDRDAVMVNPYQFVRQVRSTGCIGISLRFYFIFPKFLSFLRALEPYFKNFPLGAQYCVMGSKNE